MEAQLFTNAEKAVDDLLMAISHDIGESATSQDFEAVAALTKSASAVQMAKKLLSEEAAKISNPTITNGSFSVVVTDGAIKWSYLSVTEGINAGFFKIGQVIKITFPSGAEAVTPVMLGNRLKERGLIAKFYKEYQIQPGDILTMQQVAFGVWSLKKM